MKKMKIWLGVVVVALIFGAWVMYEPKFVGDDAGEVRSAEATAKAEQLQAGQSATGSGNKLVIRVNVRKSVTNN